MAIDFSTIMSNAKNFVVPIIAVVAICVIGFFTFKFFEHMDETRVAAIVSAAHTSGEADAQRNTIAANNAAMVKALQNLATLTQQTNTDLSNIRVKATVEQNDVQSYDSKTIAVAHPEAVEKWANDTTSNLLNSIQASSITPTTEANK